MNSLEAVRERLRSKWCQLCKAGFADNVDRAWEAFIGIKKQLRDASAMIWDFAGRFADDPGPAPDVLMLYIASSFDGIHALEVVVDRKGRGKDRIIARPANFNQFWEAVHGAAAREAKRAREAAAKPPTQGMPESVARNAAATSAAGLEVFFYEERSGEGEQ